MEAAAAQARGETGASLYSAAATELQQSCNRAEARGETGASLYSAAASEHVLLYQKSKQTEYLYSAPSAASAIAALLALLAAVRACAALCACLMPESRLLTACEGSASTPDENKIKKKIMRTKKRDKEKGALARLEPCHS